jgi:hypothetical protein
MFFERWHRSPVDDLLNGFVRNAYRSPNFDVWNSPPPHPTPQTLNRHPKALCRLIETSETYCTWTSHLLSPVFFLEFQLASYCFLRYKEMIVMESHEKQ